MNGNEESRDLFGGDTLSPDQVDEFKTKLAWTMNNRMHAQTALSTLSGPLKEEVKKHRKLADVLAECIRDKSRLPLVQAYGENKSDEIYEGIRPQHLGDFL